MFSFFKEPHLCIDPGERGLARALQDPHEVRVQFFHEDALVAVRLPGRTKNTETLVPLLPGRTKPIQLAVFLARKSAIHLAKVSN